MSFQTPTNPEALQEALVGAWHLESYIAHPATLSSSTRTIYPMTKHVTGLLLYTPDGYMSAQLLIPGQSKFALNQAREADWAEVGRRCLAYTGPYYITQEPEELVEPEALDSIGVQNKVTKLALRHGFRLCNLPGNVGDVQLRAWRFEAEGRVLVLGAEEPTEIKGELRMPELRWRRAERVEAGTAPGGKL